MAHSYLKYFKYGELFHHFMPKLGTWYIKPDTPKANTGKTKIYALNAEQYY
jgi:hypothetical protein